MDTGFLGEAFLGPAFRRTKLADSKSQVADNLVLGTQASGS